MPVEARRESNHLELGLHVVSRFLWELGATLVSCKSSKPGDLSLISGTKKVGREWTQIVL